MKRASFSLAVVVLLLNDHLLKATWPGVVTGKLSDAAGLFFFPLFLHALVPRPRRTDAALALLCVATAAAFTLAKTTSFGNEAYRVLWGAMQWPFHAARAALHGRAVPPLVRVALARDATDLLCLPFVLAAYYTGSRRFSSTKSMRSMNTVMPIKTATGSQCDS